MTLTAPIANPLTSPDVLSPIGNPCEGGSAEPAPVVEASLGDDDNDFDEFDEDDFDDEFDDDFEEEFEDEYEADEDDGFADLPDDFQGNFSKSKDDDEESDEDGGDD